jgi:hypothetical protein
MKGSISLLHKIRSRQHLAGFGKGSPVKQKGLLAQASVDLISLLGQAILSYATSPHPALRLPFPVQIAVLIALPCCSSVRVPLNIHHKVCGFFHSSNSR